MKDRRPRNPSLAFIAATVIVLAFIAGALIAAVESTRCHRRWTEANYEARWSPHAGCEVRLRIRRPAFTEWVPEERAKGLRDLDPRAIPEAPK